MTRIRRRAPRPVPPLPPINRHLDISIEQQIYRSLRDVLMAGRIRAGEGITIRSIAQLLHVSPAPVREALNRLEAEGVLFARRNSAFYTHDLSSEQFGNFLKVRSQLEGFAAHEAAVRATKKDIKRIESASLRWITAVKRRPADLAPANYGFHFSIYTTAGNPVLLGLIETLWVQLGPVLAGVEPIGDLQIALDAHAAALDAIKAGNGAAAERAIRDDLEQGGAVIIAALMKLERSRLINAA